MKIESKRPEQIMTELFEGLARHEQMALMARLEHGGGNLYRIWAESERNTKAREALIAAAEREEENARLLRLMTGSKDDCEKCGTSLAAGQAAFACSFQCTFCPECAGQYQNVCPNCGGVLALRPAA